MSDARERQRKFAEGLRAYRAGQHYEAHEFWEELWNEENDPDRSRLLQALIQVASAIHKATNDVAPRGALRLLDSAQERLVGLPDDYQGIDVAALRRAMTRVRSVVAGEIDAGQGHCRLAASHVPPIETRGEAPWPASTRPPAVPDAARSAWFERGLEAYQRAEFFEAHELWEELWRDERDPAEKQFMQGLIQVAAAMHKLRAHKQPRPAARLMARAMARLAPSTSPHHGIDVALLRRDGDEAQKNLAALPEASDGEGAVAPPRILRLS
jgi:predicted metal-dependent hydrolase